MSPRNLSAGHLKHRITIQDYADTPDGRGGGDRLWTDSVTLWARVTPLSAREAYAQGQVQGSVTHRIITRYTAGIVPRMRVSWNGRIFQILGVRDRDENQLVLELDCVEERV